MSKLREPPTRPRLAVLQFKGEESSDPELKEFITRYCRAISTSKCTTVRSANS